METFFSNKRKILLLGGAINLLILSLVGTMLISTPPGIQAQMSWTQPGTNQNAFSNFCYTYWLKSNHLQGLLWLNCLKESKKATKLLQQEISPSSFTKWPQQDSLSDLAMQKLLVNPQTHELIQTQSAFLAAIPPAATDLQALFKGKQQAHLLSTLWTYKSPNTMTPTPNPTPMPIPIPTSSPTNCDASITHGIIDLPSNPNTGTTTLATCPNQPPSCPVNPQSFLFSDVWPIAGPMLLAAISQTLQDQNGQPLEIYDAYGRLLLHDHCSVANLAQTLNMNGQPITQPNQAYQLEKDALVEIAIANSSNIHLLTALIWVVIQPDNEQVNSWVSAAILSNPINLNAAPNSGSTPTILPISNYLGTE